MTAGVSAGDCCGRPVPGSFARAWRHWLPRMVWTLVLMAAVTAWLSFAMASQGGPSIPFVTGMAVTTCLGMWINFRRMSNAWYRSAWEVRADELVYRVSGQGSVRVRRCDVRRIAQRADGTLLIRGRAFQPVVIVPRALFGYDEIRARLEGWRTAEMGTSPGLGRYIPVVGSWALGIAWLTGMSARTIPVYLPAALASVVAMIALLLRSRSDPDVSPRTAAFRVLVFIPIMALVFRFFMIWLDMLPAS